MKNNIKLFVGIVLGILISGVTVYATNYLASDVTYKDTTVDKALDELYKNKYVEYEKGEFTKYIEYNNNYICETLNFDKTYTADDKAMLRINVSDKTAPLYFNQQSHYNIIGNSINLCIINYAGDPSYSKNYTIEYKVVKNLE